MAYVLAEIAGAHDGYSDKLFQLIEAAAIAQANGIKFQLFQAAGLATPDHPQFAIWQQLSFPETIWEEAFARAQKCNLDIWIDVFDDWAQRFCLLHEAKIYGLKLHTTTVFDPRVPATFRRFKKPVLLGISGYQDDKIHQLLHALHPMRQAQFMLQHGFQVYPTPLAETTLARIGHLRQTFNLPVAFADHVDGSSAWALRVPEYALMAGATLIEKHLCLSRDETLYDSHSSLEPAEFAQMVDTLRTCGIMYGSSAPTQMQIANMRQVVVKPVLTRPVITGQVVRQSDVTYLRTLIPNALTAEEFQQSSPALARQDLPAGAALTTKNIIHRRIIAVAPCRLKSIRLPQKALVDIEGLPSVQRALINMTTFPVDEIVLATSTGPENDILQRLAETVPVQCVRGSEDDVLERLLLAADRYHAEYIVRCPADSIFASGDIIQFLVEEHLDSGVDMTMPEQPYSVGTAGEVYTVAALRKLRDLGANTNYSEYLPMYFTNNPTFFSARKVTLPGKYQHSEWRLTLDEEKDLELFRLIYASIKPGLLPVTYDDIIDFFAAYPRASTINAGIITKWKDNTAFVEELTAATTLAYDHHSPAIARN